MVWTYKDARTRRTVRWTWTTRSGNSPANTWATKLGGGGFSKKNHFQPTLSPYHKKKQSWYVDGEDATYQRPSESHSQNQLGSVWLWAEKDFCRQSTWSTRRCFPWTQLSPERVWQTGDNVWGISCAYGTFEGQRDTTSDCRRTSSSKCILEVAQSCVPIPWTLLWHWQCLGFELLAWCSNLEGHGMWDICPCGSYLDQCF